MYSWYQQLHPPTGVEHSVYCNFTSDLKKDLIVVAASQLTVYRLSKNVKDCEIGEDNEDTSDNKDKLEQLGSWQLFGVVVSMKSIRLNSSKRDMLLLSFREAKMSVVEFDIATQDIRTVSLHCFEDDINKNGMIQRVLIPRISVDPDGRCAALQLNVDSVAIIPFQVTDLTADDNLLQADVVTSRPAHNATSYTINLHEVDTRLQRIIDIKFLHGYYEPTMLILFESLRTWSGRVAIRQDTCNIVAISLNMTERLNPIVWSLNGLPYDCKYVYAVPKPIGGVLLFAVNSILYLNQSVPPYGTSLNSLTQSSTSFPLKPQEDVCLTLDNSCAAFISPESMVISLKSGELYVLTLLVDSMRSVRHFNFDKTAASVLTSCVAPMDGGYLFLGSRLGNSLLLHYTRVNQEGAADAIDAVEPASKRKRINTAADWEAADGDDLDDDEMYGKDTVTSEPLSSYNFEVCDSLLNIGPCGSAELGEPAFLSEEFVNQRETDLELAVLAGHGKNGALCILQRTVKPQVVTTFELPGCTNMWTVKTTKKDKQISSKDVASQHDFLILSRNDSTLILETEKEIMEVEESGYNTRQATVHVGNIGGDKKLILQVCESGVWLMDGITCVQHVPLELGSPIVQCSIADPYVMLLTGEGELVSLVLQDDPDSEAGVKLHCSNPSIGQIPRITKVCLYCDRSGLFQTGNAPAASSTLAGDDVISEDDYLFKSKSVSLQQDSLLLQNSGSAITSVDDEEEMLYGESDSGLLLAASSKQKEGAVQQTSDESSAQRTEQKRDTHWVVIARENQSLEIYDLHDFNLAYCIKNFSLGHKLLVNSSVPIIGESEKAQTSSDSRYSSETQINELLLIGFGCHGNRPHLLAHVDEELLIYEAFHHKPAGTWQSNSLHVRFKKVHHGMMVRSHPGLNPLKEQQPDIISKPKFCPFDNIGGYSGVFIGGSYPYWIFVGSRGALRCHPMSVDGTVTCFVPFHNVNCPHGFLYFNKQGELRICVLPLHMKYDNLWPTKKVSLRCTPHFITYSIEHKVYALTSSVSEPCTRLPYTNCDNEREFEDLEKDDRFIYPHIDKFSVQLMSPVGWELIPNARIDMEEFEHVTCMKNAWLNPGPYTTVRQNFIVLGTCNVMGEEMNSRGKIIILEVIEVVPEPGQPLTKNKLKQIYSSEQKGPVTAVCGIEGNLLAAIGQKIFIWRFDENQSLRGLAFVDTNVYIHDAFSFRNMAIVADIQRSITLLRYQEEFKTLSVLSRDVRPLEVYSSNLLVDGTSVGFLAADQEKNLILFAYDPEARESYGGSRLIRRADVHVGSHVNCMWRIGTCQIDRASGLGNSAYAAALITMMGTLDGALSYVLPITEKIYRRLLMLQNAMVTGLPHTAGLNPKAFRHVQSHQRQLSNPMKNVLDGDLLWRFNHLSRVERHELAKKIGTTQQQILDDFMDIHRSVCVM